MAMKAKASGTPAKLEATPLKVMVASRKTEGSPPRITAMAMARPMMQPPIAEMTLSLIEIQAA